MLIDIIKSVILSDNVDSTAADIRSLNPGVYPSDDDVPFWTYTSTRTLLLGADGTDEEFADVVNESNGLNVSIEQHGIDIALEVMNGGEDPQGVQIDVPGAQNVIMRILARLKHPVPENKGEYIQAIHLRLLTYFDFESRAAAGRKGGLPADLDPTIDLTASIGGFPLVSQWVRFGGTENSTEKVSFYRLAYVLQIPKLV